MLSQKQTMLRKMIEKLKRVTTRRKKMLSHLQEPPRSFVPKAPYPERLQAPKKRGKLEDILDVFKQVQINIPFLDAI
jgi:hypothetical protein